MKKSSPYLIPLMICLFLAFPISRSEGAVTYKVKKGDSYYSIAKKYHVTISDLKKANSLSSREMKPGDKVIIPSKKKMAHKKTKSSAPGKDIASSKESTEEIISPDRTAETPAHIEKNIYHRARKGETLSSISRKYSVSVAELRELNDLNKSVTLRKGQKILVKSAGPRVYTVKKGDNIWKIAKKFKIDVEELAEINEMDSTTLKVGQKIYLEEDQAVLNDLPKAEILTKNLEEELKDVSESEDFSDKSLQEKLTLFAKKLMNIPYKFGGNSILGIDCSAYVKKVYDLLGMDLPRTAREQFNEGEAIDKEELSIGDLVFFRTYASFPSHVGIYLGNNLFIHASSKGKKVKVSNLDAPYYLKRFIGAKRLLNDEHISLDPQS